MLNIGLGLVSSLVDISERAGREILKIYNTDFEVKVKDDQSPVTEADFIAESLILRSIKEGISDKFPIISEESAFSGEVPTISNSPFWLVDPLDGTKEFVNRNGEFTVNIALVENSRPVLGVIHLPTKNATYWGSPHGAFVKKDNQSARAISCRPVSRDGIKAVISRSHHAEALDKFLANYPISEEVRAGSSLKFCLIAEGLADLYPRMVRTMEWDTAAGHAILSAAGGGVKTMDGTDLTYGKQNFENPNFIASGQGFEYIEEQS